MTIGIPREIKNGETRVSLTPNGCRRITALGATVCIETGAGLHAGFADREYQEGGATILPSPGDVWEKANLILKVKEPVAAEYARIREGQILFTYLHLAAEPALAEVLCEKKVLAIAYETVEDRDGSLPLLKPMSQVAGRLAVQVGAYFLQSRNGGSGVLLGGIPGTAPGKVAIVGAGNSGAHACRMAVGMGAQVTVLDIDTRKLDSLDSEYNGRIVTLVSNPANLEEAVAEADLVIGAVLVPAARAPVVVTRHMVSGMRRGSVVVDIAVDQGGCIETIRPTSHEDPTYETDGIVHYAVPNMPALAGRTATIGLTQASEPFVAMLIRNGPGRALIEHPGLGKGVNARDGQITHPAVAHALNTSLPKH
ncbi:MAG: alanine dehydrogenase [Opitutaceae bacterium]